MHPSLAVQGTPWERRGADAVALAVLLSLLVSFWFDAVAAALFALVALGVTVARVAALPARLQMLIGVTLILAAWASVLDWYRIYPSLDMVVHVAANGLLALLAFLTLQRAGVLPDVLSRSASILVITAFGAGLGVLWEIGEWIGHTLINDSIGVGYDDTIGDLTCGLAGSLVAAVLYTRRHNG